MKTVHAAQSLQEFSPKHASADEYATFVRSYIADKESAWGAINRRDQFVRRYPDLLEWFRAPATERLGRRLYGEPREHATTEPQPYGGGVTGAEISS